MPLPAPAPPATRWRIFSNVAVNSADPGDAVAASGTAIIYSFDLTGLVAGDTIALGQAAGIPSGVTDGNINPLQLSVLDGSIEITSVIPEPSTVALTAIFGLLGLGVVARRRRG